MPIFKRVLFALLLSVSLVVVAILAGHIEGVELPRKHTWQSPLSNNSQDNQTFTIHFIDVGQGVSTLLVGSDFAVLVDTGRHDHDDVVPYLESVGINSIDLLVGTHPHADHIGQFPQVLTAFPVREVWMNGATHSTMVHERALDAILASDAGYHEPRAGEVTNIGSLHLEVLHPATLSGNLNDDSIVLRAVFGEFSVLLPGDVEAAVEQQIMQQSPLLKAQVLQLGHHGSYTSTTDAFLHQVDPEIAIYSAGRGNPYDHPHDSVMERIARFGIPAYGTDVCGTVIISSDGHGFQLNTVCDLAGETVISGAAVAIPTPTAPLADLAPSEQVNEAPGGCQPGQIDINTESTEELDRIIHIGTQRAGQITRLRPFTSVDDMIRIRGIGPARLGDIKAQGLACVE